MIAVDIVLQPDDKVFEQLLNMQNKLISQKQPFDFNKGYYPHISLAMLTIQEDQIGSLKNTLPIFTDTLKTCGFKNMKLPGGEKACGLEIENTKSLTELQQQIIQIAKTYHQGKLSDEIFYDKPNKFTLEYVEKYLRIKENPQNFHQHITLGLGHLQTEDYQELEFIAKIKLFQLGNYCTCRKPL